MVQLGLILLAALGALIALAWAMGAREPVFAISRGGPHWFVALRRAKPGVLDLATDVKVAWSSSADFAFIGEETYWTDFLILSGGAENATPLTLSGDVQDAFIARVKLARPPKLALGVLDLLIALGVLSRPAGPVIKDASVLGQNAAHLPSNESIAALLSRPEAYAPAMVNFLHYQPGEGRAAYARYGRVALRTVYRTGGHLLFYGRILEVLRAASAGPCVGAWDDVAAMRYNRPEAILSMEHAPDYRASLQHRDAGLLRTVVIASIPGGQA